MERLDFTFVNNTAIKTQFELFNSFKTFSQVNTGIYNNLVLQYIPFPVYPPPVDVVKMKQSVVFDQKGNLYILDDSGNIACQIVCQTYPYRSCLNALLVEKIMIKKIKISTSSNANQLIAPITRIESEPLTNKQNQEVYPVTISPFVVQPLLNEFIKDIYIDGKSGLVYEISPNEVVNWTIEFNFI